jgi:hypothetical protein
LLGIIDAKMATQIEEDDEDLLEFKEKQKQERKEVELKMRGTLLILKAAERERLAKPLLLRFMGVPIARRTLFIPKKS